MHKKEFKMIDEFISDDILKHLQKNYFNNINLQAPWDDFFKKILNNEYPMQENIERFAETGIINLNRMSNFTLNSFDQLWELYFGDPAQQPAFVKCYLCLILYLGAIGPIPTPLENFNPLFIYFRPEFFKTLTFIEKELALPMKEILQDLGGNSTTILLELILLAKYWPYFQELIHDKPLLRKTMLKNLLLLYEQHGEELLPLSTYYANFQQEAFFWLENETEKTIDYILYTIAIYHAAKNIYYAEGLKKEFGYYQRVFDPQSANAVYGIPYLENMYLMKGNLALYAGITNIKQIEILENGDLVLSFRKTQFLSREILDRAVLNAALVIVEYLQGYFYLSTCNPQYNSYKPLLLLESSANDFGQLIIEQLRYLSMDFYKAASVSPALSTISNIEKRNYLQANRISDTLDSGETIINLLISKGYHFPWKMTSRAFEDARIINLEPGDYLCLENSLAEFIFIPLAKGLKGNSIKSDIVFYPLPFVPVGQVAVIENWHRTATIVAEKPVSVLMIRSEIYLAYWKVDYSEAELFTILAK